MMNRTTVPTEARCDEHGAVLLVHPGEPSWATCCVQSLMLMMETSATLRALAESEEFESSVGTTSRINRRLLLSILLTDSDKDSEAFKKARKQVFAMLVSTASLTKRKVRAKKLLKDYSAKVSKTNPDRASIADACSELINKFPTKSSTRDSMMPS
eukprot:1678276-Amphidinium_carterae.1